MDPAEVATEDDQETAADLGLEAVVTALEEAEAAGGSEGGNGLAGGGCSGPDATTRVPATVGAVRAKRAVEPTDPAPPSSHTPSLCKIKCTACPPAVTSHVSSQSIFVPGECGSSLAEAKETEAAGKGKRGRRRLWRRWRGGRRRWRKRLRRRRWRLAWQRRWLRR